MTSKKELTSELPVSDKQLNKPGISDWVELQQIGEHTNQW